jgi:anti-sigma28 factor (negative regulator of flagellin synthesis)
MDPLNNPRLVKRPPEDPAEPANEIETREAQESGKLPSDKECLIQALLPVLDANAIDEARREKIENIKKALADGTYNVSAEEVARKLIEHMLEPKE